MTEQLYLEDMHLLESDAELVRAGTHEDGRRYFVVDRTPFHPQGGGQPADQGRAITADGIAVAVTDVRHGPDEEVWHFAEIENGGAGRIRLEVDERRRSLLSRLHSAGHVIDMAVDALGWGWKPGKGYHFPDGAYVEYEGDLSAAGEDRVSVLERESAKVVESDLAVSVSTVPRLELARDPRVEIDKIPGDGPVRVVSFGETRIPCGGTHVKRLSEVGTVTIRKIKSKKGLIRVGYDVG